MLKKVLLVLMLVIVGYFGVSYYASNQATKNLQQIIQDSSDVVSVKYDQVDVGLLNNKITISDVSLTPAAGKEEIKIEKIILREFDRESEIPKSVSMSINGLNVELDENDKHDLELIKGFFPEGNLLVDIDLAYNYDVESDQLMIETLATDIEDIGRLNFGLHIEGIENLYALAQEHSMDNIQSSADLFSGLYALESLLSELSEIQIYSASVIYQEHQLFEKIINDIAEREGISTSRASKKLSSTVVNSDFKQIFGGKFSREVETFINNPKQGFNLTISPKKPVSAGEISKSVIAAGFGVEAKDIVARLSRKLNINFSAGAGEN